MSNLQSQLMAAIKTAMKEKSPDLTTLRMALSELKYVALEKKGELSKEEEQKLIRRLVKQREESAKSYRDGGNEDRALQEESEIECLAQFLPKELSEEEIRALLAPIAQAHEGGPIGPLMKPAMAAVAGRAPGNKVKAILEELAGSQ